MICLRGLIGRQRRRILALGAAALLSLVLAWAHSNPGEHEMSGEMGAAISICLAVLEGGTALLLVASGFRFLPRRPRNSFAPALGPVAAARFQGLIDPIRPRAGPDRLQVFLR